MMLVYNEVVVFYTITEMKHGVGI